MEGRRAGESSGLLLVLQAVISQELRGIWHLNSLAIPKVSWELPLELLPQIQHGTGEKTNFLHFSFTIIFPLFFSWWKEFFVAVMREEK